MEGKKVESIGTYTVKEISKMDKDFAKWKNAKKTQEKYRVQWYDRLLFKPKKRKIIIDFGDYSYFGLIRTSKAEWEALEQHRSRPVSLDV